MIDDDTRVDSPEGIAYLLAWAKAHGFVLDPWHERLANKHGVSTAGVMFTQLAPMHPRAPNGGAEPR